MSLLKRLYNKLPSSFRSQVRSLFPQGIRRWYAHYRADIYLISYPKCGRTWLRLMIGRALSQYLHLPEDEKTLFLEWSIKPHPNLPNIRVIHDDRPMLKAPQELETSKEKFRTKKVIFLARDPRDVIVSSYFEKKKRSALFGSNPYEGRDPGFSGEMPEFIHQEVGGFETLLRYYNIWAKNRHIPAGFLLVRYEDLKANPASELRRVLDFIGFPQVSEEVVQGAVTFASFTNMRQMEREGRFSTQALKPADEADPESFKTRKGKIGGYKEHLSPLEIERLDQKMQSSLSDFFGYHA